MEMSSSNPGTCTNSSFDNSGSRPQALLVHEALRRLEFHHFMEGTGNLLLAVV
jgi:hypothetical protein